MRRIHARRYLERMRTARRLEDMVGSSTRPDETTEAQRTITDEDERIFPLDAMMQAALERAFDADLSDVRIHLGARADRMARDTGARAITIGRDIYFARGEYAPDTEEGQALLIHEMVHVLQHIGGRRMVYVEDLADLETDALMIEALLDGRPIGTAERDALQGNDRYALTNVAGGVSRDGVSLYKKAAGGDAGNINTFLAERGGKRVLYRLSTGQIVEMTPEQYEEMIRRASAEVRDEVDRWRETMTEERFSEKILALYEWAHGGTA